MDMPVDVPAIYDHIKNPKDWSGQNAMLEKLNVGLILVDWLQTQEIVKNPNIQEQNLFLGHYPSMARVNTLIPLGLISQLVVARLLPPVYRDTFQVIIFSSELMATSHNHNNLGIRIGFDY